jgi:DnaJ-class molecular chaperone
VPVWDLILGAETEIRDLLGNRLSLAIPARTQPGTNLRLRGKGLSQQNGSVGDLFIKLQARIPEQIDQELLAKIEQNRGQ